MCVCVLVNEYKKKPPTHIVVADFVCLSMLVCEMETITGAAISHLKCLSLRALHTITTTKNVKRVQQDNFGKK